MLGPWINISCQNTRWRLLNPSCSGCHTTNQNKNKRQENFTYNSNSVSFKQCDSLFNKNFDLFSKWYCVNKSLCCKIHFFLWKHIFFTNNCVETRSSWWVRDRTKSFSLLINRVWWVKRLNLIFIFCINRINSLNLIVFTLFNRRIWHSMLSYQVCNTILFVYTNKNFF